MNEKICTVTTLKAPKEQVINFINYHLNIGVDHMFLFFDDPKDKSISEFKKYKNITCVICDSSYWEKLISKRKISLKGLEDRQRANANLAMEKAKKMDFKWVLHLDVDELIYIKENLKSFLRKIPDYIDFVRLPSIEAVPEKMRYKENIFLEVNLFKNNFWKFSKKFFKSHIAGKSIIRVGSKVWEVGIHRPHDVNKELKSRVSLYKARVLHFNCCGFDNWKTRWIWRKDGTEGKEGGKKYDKMIKRFRQIFEQGDEIELMNLYKKEFFISEWKKKIFLFMGILLKIKLNNELFNKSTK